MITRKNVRASIQRSDLLTLAVLLAVALIARSIGFTWGLPGAVGEMTPIEQAWKFWGWGSPGGPDFNPHSFGWPSFVFYLNFLLQALLYLGGRLFHAFSSSADFRILYETDPSSFVLAGRVISTAADLGAIAATYAIGRRLFGRAAGAAAALILAVDVHHVAWSQNNGPEVWVALFVLLGSLALLRVAERGELRDYVLFGISTGLGMAAKYTPILLLAALPLAHRAWPARPRRRALAALAAAGVSFFVASPFVILDPQESLFYSFSQFHRLARVPHFGQEGLGPGWIFYVRHSLPEAMGPLLLVVGGAGLVAALARRRREMLLAIFPLLYFAFIGAGSSKYDHYVLPLTPFLALAASALLWEGARRLAGAHQLAVVLPVLVIAAGIVFPVTGLARRQAELSRPDSRRVACTWIEENVPPGALILSEFGGPILLTTERLRAIREDPAYRDIAARLLRALASRPAYAVVYLPLFAQEPTESAPFYELGLYPGFDFCLLSSEVSGRYRRQPTRFARQVAFYRSLEALATPPHICAPAGGPGPTIRVFSLTGVRERYEAGGGPDLARAWSGVRSYAELRAERAADFAVRLARAYESRGLWPEATIVWAAAAEFAPTDPEVHHALAVALDRAGHADHARREYERVLALRPDHAGALNNLGSWELRHGQPAAALRFFERALASDPGLADAHANLGWLLLMEKGDREGARRHFEEALRLAPAHPQAERVRRALEELRAPGRSPSLPMPSAPPSASSLRSP